MDLSSNKLRRKFLSDIGVREGIINFLSMHKLEKYAIHELDITGDYVSNIERLNICLSRTYTYNASGKLISDEELAKQLEGWVCTYDDIGNILTRTSPDGESEEWTYDEHGNELSYKTPDGNLKEWEYDSRGLWVTGMNSGSGWRYFTYTYDNRGNAIEQIDGDRTQTATYDGNNNRLSHTRSGSAYGSFYFKKEWTYDSNNEVVSYNDTGGYRYSNENLPDGVLCQVFFHDDIVLEIKVK